VTDLRTFVITTPRGCEWTRGIRPRSTEASAPQVLSLHLLPVLSKEVRLLSWFCLVVTAGRTNYVDYKTLQTQRGWFIRLHSVVITWCLGLM